MTKKSDNPTTTHDSPKRTRLQKCWRVVWPVLLIVVLLWLGAIFCMFVPSFGHEVEMISQWLNQYTKVTMCVQATLILSTIVWWPMLIQYKGKRHGWERATIQALSQRKWRVCGLLFFVYAFIWLL